MGSGVVGASSANLFAGCLARRMMTPVPLMQAPRPRLSRLRHDRIPGPRSGASATKIHATLSLRGAGEHLLGSRKPRRERHRAGLNAKPGG